jgi:ubiquinone/menaquinone biosynthesis C-methylase UbiE
MSRTDWPKTLAPLSAEQRRISDDFMKYWHEVLPKKYSLIDKFNHSYPIRTSAGTFLRTLEIGAGIGEHLQYERLTPEQERGYHALELRENMSRCIRDRFPRVRVVTGDCQERLGFADGYFDRILAIHVLEHLPNLPAAVDEAYRVCDKRRGRLHVVIPCEGSPAYTLARKLSAQRIFEKRYRQPYKWFIEREHLNRPREILKELGRYFTVVHQAFFPIPLPLIFCNLVIGLTLEPKDLSR